MITKEQALALKLREEIHSSLNRNRDGTCAKWRVNGQVKTWKTRPEEFRVPVKYGMYTYGYVTDISSDDYHLADECTLTVRTFRDTQSDQRL